MFLRSLCVGQFCAERVSAVPVISLAPTKEKNQQINVERSLFQIRSLRRLVSALAISAAHVSIFYGNVALDNLQWRTKDKNY